MLKNSLSILAALAGISLTGPASLQTAFAPARISGARNSKRYPEQSSRQAMRGYRRAQRGPGIELNTKTGEYDSRDWLAFERSIKA